MTIQDAYNKGLDDAENKVIEILDQILQGEVAESFANPKLQALSNVVWERSQYFRNLAQRNNNVGKHFKKLVAAQQESIDLSKS